MDKKYKIKFVKRQFLHMRLVQDNMAILEENIDKLPFKINDFELIKRSLKHDSDKLTTSIKDYFNIFEYKETENNSFKTEKLYDCAFKHYNSKRHHFEYHIKNNIPLNFIDICEMCCDMWAIKQEYNENYQKLLEYSENLINKNINLVGKYKKYFFDVFNLLNQLS